MKNVIFLVCFLLFVLVILTFMFYFSYFFEYNTYTHAVCSGSVCRDYIFTCLNGEVVDSHAISGLVVFDDNWVDLRVEKDKC